MTTSIVTSGNLSSPTDSRALWVRSMRDAHTLLALIALVGSALGCDAPSVATTRREVLPDQAYTIPPEFDGAFIEVDYDQDPPSDPCDPNPCPVGSRCEGVAPDSLGDMGDRGALEATCTPLSCDEIVCPAGQRCEESASGGACVDAGCAGPEECETEEFCSGEGLCVPDLCRPNERQCMDDLVLSCVPDGSQFITWVTCPQGPEQCVTSTSGDAACECVDDWDCPEHLTCDQGLCRGRPEPASCILPPEPFTASIPAQEIVWGGTADEALAPMSPFPESVQVVMTPLVANLNDDNGDGLIDEGDLPDIIFMSFCDSTFSRDGALRAIHGGGPRRGQDLFASLGEQTWYEGQPLESVDEYRCSDGILDPTAGIAVANLDPLGDMYPEPEIVGVHKNNGLVVYNHRGEIITSGFLGQGFDVGPNPTPSIANIDAQGMAEVVISRTVYTLGRVNGELQILDRFDGQGARGTNRQGGISCVADLDGDGRSEIIAGGTVYGFPQSPAGATRTQDCIGNGGMIEPSNEEEERWCNGQLNVVWIASVVNQARTPRVDSPTEGFCAVADIWGADALTPPGPANPLDQKPEIIIIQNGKLFILDSESGHVIFSDRYGSSNSDLGGAPNVGDFDNDGFPEVGSAFAAGYVMMDLQTPTDACPEWVEFTEDNADNGLTDRPERAPGGVCNADADCAEGGLCRAGQCICAHQGWRRRTEDGSSRVTGSTLFDFNGDGSVEVIYNDECFFRIYDGSTGETLFVQPSESRTRIEHPIVADVDADGNAEIVFSTSTESRFCSIRDRESPLGVPYAALYNPGIEVWGDPQDRWVPARKIWNQHAYHVTHISESGDVPIDEPEGWISIGSRSYNAYRAQPPSYGIAPDLQLEELRATAGASCDEQAGSGGPVNLSVTVYNRGEVQVGAGLEVTFWVRRSGMGDRVQLFDPTGEPLVARTPIPLSPGDGVTLSVSYRADLDPSGRGALSAQDEVIAEVDRGGATDFGQERECDEENNEQTVTLSERGATPDLTVEMISAEVAYCPELKLNLAVSNLGQGEVSSFEIGLYLGDAAQGGTRIDTLVIDEPLAPGATVNLIWESQRFPSYRTAAVTLSVDPRNAVVECDDNNNTSDSSDPLTCEVRDGQ